MSRPIIEGFLDGLKPPTRYNPSDWADEHRFLSSKASAEPGRWRTSRTPYLREIMNRFDPYDPVQEVVVMKGAQIGMSECGFNIMGYYAAVDPCAILYVMPTDATLKKNVKLRVNPMIEASPVLSKKITSGRRDSANTMTQKDFPGGAMLFAGANSASGLRSLPIKVLILDEVDGYPLDLDGEGSPVDLAKKRTATYPNRKIAIFSTPTDESTSVIEKEFLATDQRYYHVPCPHCGTMQKLEFDRLVFDESVEKVTEASYDCIGCDELIEERYKSFMLANGEWIAENPDAADPLKVGYHIGSMLSPYGWFSWREIAQQYLDAKKSRSLEKMKVFVNTVLGETFKQTSKQPKAAELHERAGGYEEFEVPASAAILTAGVDVQDDRLELEVVAWSEGLISHSVAYKVLMGSTEKDEVWEKLRRELYTTYDRADGVPMGISRMCVDSGYRANRVYRWCNTQDKALVVPIKGQPNVRQTTMLRPPQKVSIRNDGQKVGRTQLWNIGVDIIKTEVYGFLNLSKNEDGSTPPGYCFFPKRDISYFHMLTAERKVKQADPKGFWVYIWQNIKGRNEALDCRVYARAGAEMLGVSRWEPHHWEISRTNPYSPTPTAALPEGDRKGTPVTTVSKPRKARKSSYW